MDDIKYNFKLLREARIALNMTMDNVAFDLCLAPRQIHSIENNLPDFFYSPAIKLTCIKKYAEKLGLDIDEVLYLKETPLNKTTSKATREEFVSEDVLASRTRTMNVNREVKKESRKRQHKQDSMNHPAIKTVITYIQNNLASKITMAHLMDAANYSERSIQLVFEKHFNQTPFEYIEEQRLNKAKCLIEQHKQSKRIADIAQDVGMTHLGRFSVNFKRRFGLSPSALAKA